MLFSTFMRRFQKSVSLCIVFLLVLFSSGAGQYVPVASAAASTWADLLPGHPDYGTRTIDDIAYGNGQWFVANGIGFLGYSANGTSWQHPEESTVVDLEVLTAVAYAGDRWVGVGQSGVYLTSNPANPLNAWQVYRGGSTPTSENLWDLTYGIDGTNGIAHTILVGENGTILTSVNNASFSSSPSKNDGSFLMAAAYGNGKYVAAGYNSDFSGSVVYSSVDGETFNTGTIGGGGVADVVYGEGKFVAIGPSGFIATSADGQTWTPRSAPAGAAAAVLNGVAYGGGKFVAVGDGGVIISSEDGVTWISETPKTSGDFKSVAYGQDRYIIAGPQGKMQTTIAPEEVEDPLIKLTDLEVTPPGGLSFDPDTETYTVSVPHGTETVDVTATMAAIAGANWTVNGQSPVGGTVEVNLDLDGTTVIDVDVTADGHTANQYTITVTEQPLIKLTDLEVTPPGGLSFDPNTETYSVTVPHGTTVVDVTPTLPAAAGANATVNGEALVGGKVEVDLDLDGTTVINVNVTATGHTANQYTITVTTADPLIKLTDLEVTPPGGLSFDPDTETYTVTVPHGTETVDVTATMAALAGANWTVNGQSPVGGTVEVNLDPDGTTVIDVDVTADGHMANQYTITVTEQPLIKLTDLEVTPPGGLSFDPDTETYTVSVPFGTETVDVTGTMPAVAGANWTANGQSPVGGTVEVDLDADGTTVIEVDVSATGHTANRYTITVTELPLIKLTGLEVTPPGGLSFDPDTETYTVSVLHGTESVNVTATMAAIAGANWTVNGQSPVGGTVEVNLDPDGTTVIDVDVTADGHTANQYTITVTEQPLMKLAGLEVTPPGGLSFDPDTETYTVSVPYGTTAVDVETTLPPVIGAIATVNGESPVGGIVEVDLDADGTTVIEVDVSATGYTANRYTITVTELPLIKLTGLEVTPPGGLSFDADTETYTVSVPYGTATVDVTATMAAIAGANWTANGQAPVGGTVEVNLDPDGTTVIDVDVTADGHTANQYTITVTEQPLMKLAGLEVTPPGGLSFDPDTETYTVSVPYGTTAVDVETTLPPVIGAIATVNGESPVGGIVEVDLDADGTTVIEVDVSATGYTANRYTITVTELPLIKLTGLEVTPPGGLSFDADTETYTVSVPYGTATVDVTATMAALAGANWTANGQSPVGGTVEVDLDADGTTVIEVDVSATGHTANRYTITVTEQPLMKLTDLEVTPPGTLVFDPDTETYSVEAPYGTTSVDVTATLPAVAGASVTVNGETPVGGTVEVDLNAVGTTVIDVDVTATGYTANQYTITVSIGLPSDNASLSNLTVNTGKLTPDFASNVDAYSMSVPFNISSLNVTPTLADGTATLRVNGNPADSGNAVPVNLNVGPNAITVLVTAQDNNTTMTYTINITRQAYVPPVDETVKGTLQGSITKLIGTNAKLIADVYSADGKTLIQAGVDVNGANGKFVLNKIEPGSYRMVLYVLADSGTKLAGQTASLTVNNSKEATASASVIDPFGKVTDELTKKVIDGVKVTVFWADTAENRSQGRTPGTQVALPKLSAMTNQNQNGQLTTKDGQFGWLLLPNGDYYITAEKEGYDAVRSSVFHVGETAVRTDLTLAPKVLEEGVIEPYITGYPDGTFRPNNGITRAELAAVLLKVLKIKAETAAGEYSDVTTSNWAAEAIAEVSKRGLMIGYPDGTFRPNQQVTRGEIAVVLGKVKQLTPGSGKSSFQDIKGHWAEQAILLAEQAGLITGHADGSYRPNSLLTRAQAVVIFNKVLGWSELNVDKPQRWSDVPKNYWAYKDIMRASVAHAYKRLGNGTVVWE